MGLEGHYLQRRQIAIVFLAFVALAVPLSYAQISPSVPASVGRGLMVAYIVLLGNTHFAITWALYLNSANVRYFGSSIWRKVVYFLMPVAILAVFCAIGVLELPHAGTSFFVGFSIALAAADYFHVVRQSFGVYQMFKARVGASFPRSLTRVDNWYFMSLLGLQLITFVTGVPRGFDGRFNLANPLTRIALAIAAILFVMVVRGLLNARKATGADRGAMLAAIGYLLLQSASALLVIYRSRLYLASLAMHYVEYHVLMVPRLFNSDLDLSTRMDRLSAYFRRHKVMFYAVLVTVAACVSGGTLLAIGGIEVTKENSKFGWLFINMLNGIFLAHYFIEGFVWKFGNPYYRQSLAPIYFPARGPAQARGSAQRRQTKMKGNRAATS